MSVPVSSLQGNVNITGTAPSVQQLNQVSAAFNQTAAAGTASLRSINQFGSVASQIIGGLGIATGVAAITAEFVKLGKESVDLAVNAETIGTAYEGAARRAGISADELRDKLREAARGTATDSSLAASATAAMALGVGQNAQQIADLLSIARQKGKDFGETTEQAFSDISRGLGRNSKLILDNLGIIVNDKKAYDDYAVSIGKTSSQLSDQEKRQALVNVVIRDNTDLIAKNADAQLSAADTIAQANTRIAESQTRIGASLIPLKEFLLGTTATFLESVTGQVSARADELNRQLAAQATSAQDYVEKYNAAVKRLNPSGMTQAGTIDELIGQYLALRQLTAAEVDQIRMNAQSDAGRTEAIRGYQESGRAIVAVTAATVDYTKELAALKDQLTSARGFYDKWSNTVITGTKAYEHSLSDLSIQEARADQALIDFQRSGSGLSRILDPMQRQIDDTAAATAEWASQLDEITSFVEEQQRVLGALTQEQKAYDRAVQDSGEWLKQNESRLDALQDHYNDLGDAVEDARHKMDDLRDTPLVGEAALDDRLFDMDRAVKKQQLAIARAEDRGASRKELDKMREQLDRLRRAEDEARLAGELRYDKEHRLIDQAGVDRKGQEKTVGEVTSAIAEQQKVIDANTAAQTAMQGEIAGAQMTVDQARQSLLEATGAQRLHNEEVAAATARLEELQKNQDTINKSYDLSKTKLDELKTAYNDAKDKALQPFKDKIDDIRTATDTLQNRWEIDTGAMRADIDATEKNLVEKNGPDILLGLVAWGKQVDLLTGQYDALLLAQKRATDPSLAVPPPGTGSPTTAHPIVGGSGGYSAQAIDAVLAEKGSPLAGQGQFIIDMSLKYGIPVEVALAMWKIEGQYGTTGAGVRNKNPGNLRGSPLESGNDGSFSQFASWQTGMEAFFKLLSEDPGKVGYRADVDRYKQGDITGLLDLIKVYAPAADNNDPAAYYQGVKDMIAMLLRLIMGGPAATQANGAPGRPGIINNNTDIDDPRPSESAVTNLFGPGATIGDTYDADRTGTTGRHYGVDIIMAPGTKLLSPVAGTVIKAGQGSKDFQGGVVMINDTLGREWYFGHVHNIQVKEWQTVLKGTLLAYIGEEAHTHVQIREGGVQLPVDPSAAIDYAAAQPSGAGDYMPQGMDIGGPNLPSFGQIAPRGGARAFPDGMLAYLKAMKAVDDAAYSVARGMDTVGDEMSIAGPNLPKFGDDISKLGAAAAAAAEGVSAVTDALTGLIQKTGERGGVGTIGGPDAGEPAVTEGGGDPNETFAPRPGTEGEAGGGRQSNDPKWPGWHDILTGGGLAQATDAAEDANKAMGDVVGPWSESWDKLAEVATVAMDDTVVAVRDGGERVLRNIHRITDELKALLDLANSLSHTGGGGGGSGGGGGGGDGGGGNGGGSTFHSHYYKIENKNAVKRLLDKTGNR